MVRENIVAVHFCLVTKIITMYASCLSSQLQLLSDTNMDQCGLTVGPVPKGSKLFTDYALVQCQYTD